jgi:stage III sporulation protein AF
MKRIESEVKGMPQIAEWLKNIVVAIILAGFLEMLLPNNDLKNVTRMMMGLVILSILLQPLIRFFDLPGQISLSLPSISSRPDSAKTQQLIVRGLKMRDEWTHQLKEQYKANLESKLRNILGLMDEIHLENLYLQYQGERLERAFVKIKFARPGTSVSQIGDMKRKVISRARDSVRFLTDLREDQIEVNFDGR